MKKTMILSFAVVAAFYAGQASASCASNSQKGRNDYTCKKDPTKGKSASVAKDTSVAASTGKKVAK